MLLNRTPAPSSSDNHALPFEHSNSSNENFSTGSPLSNSVPRAPTNVAPAAPKARPENQVAPAEPPPPEEAPPAEEGQGEIDEQGLPVDNPDPMELPPPRPPRGRNRRARPALRRLPADEPAASEENGGEGGEDPAGPAEEEPEQ